MFILGLALTTLGATGWYFSPGWCILSLVLPFLLREHLFAFYPFMLYAFASALCAYIPVQAIWGLWMLSLLAMSFTLGRLEEAKTENLIWGMLAGLIVGIPWMLLWYAGSIPYRDEFSSPGGLFLNPNVLGEIAALIAVGLVIMERYWLTAIPIAIMLLAGSRTAAFGAATALMIYLWKLSKLSVAGAGLCLIFALVAAGWQGRDLRYTLDYSVYLRSALWRDTISGFKFWGNGPASFDVTFGAYAKHFDVKASRPDTPHNDYLDLIYQYGIGVLLLGPFILIALIGPLSLERSIFLVFCVIAITSFPLSVPAEGFLAAFTMGKLYSRFRLAWGERVGGPILQGKFT